MSASRHAPFLGAVHELKTHCEPFEAVRTYAKRAEYRRDDRGFEVGDRVKLREWDPRCGRCRRDLDDGGCDAYGLDHTPYGYTGRDLLARITHIARGPYIPPGYAMLSIEVLG